MSTQKSAVAREDLHLLYNVSVADISAFKQQQWNVTNNALLLQAALIGVREVLDRTLTTFEAWALILLSCALTAAAILVIVTLQCSILARRERLRRVRTELGDAFEELWRVSKPPDAVHSLLYVVLSIACGVVVWLILGKL